MHAPRLGLVFVASFAASCATSTAVPKALEVTPPSGDAALNQFFKDVFDRKVSRSPQFQTLLGVKKDYGAWDDLSDARAQEEHALDQTDLARLRSFDVDALSPKARVSYRVFEYLTDRSLERFPWRFHSYPVNQMHGTHSFVAAFLINYHRIDSVSDAEAYLSRLRGLPAMFGQLEQALLVRQARGVVPPKFVFPKVIGSCRNLAQGTPFLNDFTKKVEQLKGLDDDARNQLLEAARAAIDEAVAPAYTSLIAVLESLEQKATTDDGAWKFPEGETFYAHALRWTTTTGLSPDKIHAIGLAEVERIHGEMREIMKRVSFEGSLPEFFAFMRTDPRFYYSNDDAGRQAYLTKATEIIDDMKSRLPTLFSMRPKADVVVKRVEAFREKAAGKAFYNRPALDGSTPGYYYANLYDMADMPTYQMEALAYHEAIPGHHMQIALTQELESLPSFRKFSRFTAYTEGWGLYSELVPKELGLYSDPYSDFGRLAMELWRACRLVVDTGIHHKKWTREQAITFLGDNTPNPKGDVVKAIERYIVMPSQATAYKVGMLKILELRQKAKAAMGEAFDLRGFHDVVLGNGPVPLMVLEELVTDWVTKSSQG